jgi:hypothetical protein
MKVDVDWSAGVDLALDGPYIPSTSLIDAEKLPLDEDTIFDYDGFIIGEAQRVAFLLCKAPVDAILICG